MKKVFILDGGAGRVITAIPALERYIVNNPNHDVKILIHGWENMLWSNPLLQDKCFNIETKGIFESVFKDADEVVSPEPYRVPDYYNQKISLAQAFDKLINGDIDPELSIPNLYTCKAEEKNAANIIVDTIEKQGKDITIVIQPYGRSARIDRNDIIDDSSRGFDSRTYLKLVEKLSKKYNLILFADKTHWQEQDVYTVKPEMELRTWFSLIECCDYFIGCDSVGQHIARAFNKPGTVIIGSTFPINVTYPDWFQIIEKEGIKKAYSPIRISGLDGHLADRHNDRCMEFTDDELDDIVAKIESDIENKVKK